MLPARRVRELRQQKSRQERGRREFPKGSFAAGRRKNRRRSRFKRRPWSGEVRRDATGNGGDRQPAVSRRRAEAEGRNGRSWTDRGACKRVREDRRLAAG